MAKVNLSGTFIHEKQIGYAGFIVKFILSFALLKFLFDAYWIKEFVLDPYTKLTAIIASQLISHLGIENTIEGFTIIHNGSSVNISSECSAIEVFLVYFCAVISYPKSLREKLIGLSIGLPAIYAINMFRIIALFIVVSFASESFDLFHLWIGQAAVIAVTFGIWQLWVSGRLKIEKILRKENLGFLEQALVFFSAIIFGLILYRNFINTASARTMADILVRHSHLLLSIFGIETQTSTIGIRNSLTNINVVTSCLAPPLSILYFAFLLAARFNIRGKLALLLASIPLFYVMGIIKVSSFFFTPYSSQSIQEGFFYNHYYPTIFTFIFVSGTIYLAFKDEPAKRSRYYAMFLATSFAAIIIWKIAGPLYMDLLVMIPLKLIFGISAISYDPYEVFSAMPAYQSILSISLLLLMPPENLGKNAFRLLKILAFMLIWQIVIIGAFNIYPIPIRVGYLRMLSIVPPLTFWLYFMHSHKTSLPR